MSIGTIILIILIIALLGGFSGVGGGPFYGTGYYGGGGLGLVIVILLILLLLGRLKESRNKQSRHQPRKRVIQHSRDAGVRSLQPRRTGYSAFAEYDGRIWGP